LEEGLREAEGWPEAAGVREQPVEAGNRDQGIGNSKGPAQE
jgi:hypothetical protein